jgi:hypothetical protein
VHDRVADLDEAGDRQERDRGVVDSVRALIGAAHDAEALPPDVEAEDLLLFLSVVTRPLPNVPDELNASLRDRMLGTLLDGL